MSHRPPTGTSGRAGHPGGKARWLVIGLAALAGFFFYVGQSEKEPSSKTTQTLAISAPAPETILTPGQIVEKLKPATVHITTEFTKTNWLVFTVSGGGTGSGVIVSKDNDGDYWILTNAHVLGFYDLRGADFRDYGVEVRFHDGRTAPIIALLDHETQDFSMICVDGSVGDYPVADMTHGLPAVGDTVYALGHPRGLEYSFTTGMVSAIRDHALVTGGPAPFHRIQTDTALNPGNSGGPLIDQTGFCVGINTEIYGGQQQGLNFAYSTADILRDYQEGRFYPVVLSLEGIRDWVGALR